MKSNLGLQFYVDFNNDRYLDDENTIEYVYIMGDTIVSWVLKLGLKAIKLCLTFKY